MITPELEEYIKTSRQGGFSDEQIRENILSSGWSKEDTDEALNHLPTSPFKSPRSKKLMVLTVVVLPLLVATSGLAYYFVLVKSQSSQPVAKTPSTTSSMSPLATSSFNTSGDISSWKTYKNDTSGIEFKYPANFIVQENPPGSYGPDGDILLYNFDYLFNPTYSEGGTYSSEPTRYINFSLLFHPESAALQSSPILKNGKVSFGSVLYYKIPTIPGRKNSHDAQYFFQNTESSKSVLISYSPIIDESDIGISQSDLMAGLKVVQNNPAYLNSESQIAILNQVLASVILVAPASTPVSSNPLAAYTPTNVTAFMKQNTAQPTVQILWNSKYDSTLHQKNFTLERQTDGGNFQILAQPIDPMYEDMTIEGGKTYAYRVQTNFTSGSSPYSLLTSITVPISGDGVSNVTAETTTSTATIRFTTSGETQASLRYHTVDQLYNYTLVQDADSTFKTSHEIDIPNLKSGTIYKYYIEVGDKNGLYQKTSEFSFTTK